MARPIWSGSLSFGLLHVPVSLMSGERRTDIQFRMLDVRDKAPIRYERVNADTGEEVPWKDIVRAFEYDKGSYVVLEEADIKEAAPESHQSIDLEAFVARDELALQYFEKPYVLVPQKKAEKGYVLLRETLASTQRIGIARVVIRTREHLAAVVPDGAALLLILLRYPQELVPADDYAIPDKPAKDYRVSAQEIRMAEQLVESMTATWRPDAYKDEFRERLHTVIAKRMKQKGAVAKRPLDDDAPAAATPSNVVDFMQLLKKSLESRPKGAAVKGGAAAAHPPARKGASKAASAASAATPAKAAKAAKAAPRRRRAS